MKNLVSYKLFESSTEKELWYVKDANGVVKNISTSSEDANTFLSKSLKDVGKVFYVTVPEADWDSEKISVSNIDRLAKQKYQ